MFVSNSTLESLASRFIVGRTVLDERSQESFSTFVPATTKAAAATLGSGSDSSASQGNAQDETAYEESFARLMLSLKTQGQTSLSTAVADSDNGASSVISDESLASVYQDKSFTSVQQEFLEYLQQPPAERLREQLTGVSKEEYDLMTPEQQAAVDQRLQDALKQRQALAQEAGQDDINTRIKALKAGLIA